jgi:hypothetical protein
MIAAADGFEVDMRVVYPEWFEQAWQCAGPGVDPRSATR